MKKTVEVMLSNRHVHLSKNDANKLFGEGYEITVKNMLTDVQFAANETVTISGSKGNFENVRILGPYRNETQVELLLADCFKLGIKAPIRESGKLNGAASLKIIGPSGEIDLNETAIVAWRHIHMPQSLADEFGLKDKQIVQVKTEGERGLIFGNVLIRVIPYGDPVMHIDTEEGNSAGLKNKDLVEILA
ncbi:MAG: phosphate propanoyltransferase [Sedimentibacter sp.]